MISERDRCEFYWQHHQVIGEYVVIYEAQQKSLDANLTDATAYNVQSRAVIQADFGPMLVRKIISQMREEITTRT